MGKFTDKEFVNAWLKHCNGGSYSVIADDLGVSRQYVEHYGAKLRKLGVKLPRIVVVYRPAQHDIKGLNETIKSAQSLPTNTGDTK